MALFIFNQEKALVGKLSKRMCKPFNVVNDKIIIEKNLRNLLSLKLLYSNYVDDNGNTIADTIAIDTKTSTLYLIGYKRSSKDNFIGRYKKQYDSLIEDKDLFLERAGLLSRKNDLSIYNFKAIFIASNFSAQDIKRKSEFPLLCDFYTWSYINNIIIFKKVKYL